MRYDDFSDEQLLELRHQAKGELRRRLRSLRRSIPRSAREERSSRVVNHLLSIDPVASATTTASFLSMSGEVDLKELHAEFAAKSVGIALPHLSPGDVDLKLRRWTPGQPLEESGYGFEQPGDDSPVVADAEVQVIFVPALAADERGHRLGWGKGFYDRLLPRLGALRVGVIYDFQRMAELPNTPGDVPLDVIVSDAGVQWITPPDDPALKESAEREAAARRDRTN